MKRSTDRILVTHQGTLPRPDDLRDMLSARSSGQPYDRAALTGRIQRAVREAVQQQIACGIDVVNDGEMSKTSFSDYVSGRLGGLAPTAEPYVSPINGRDWEEVKLPPGKQLIPGVVGHCSDFIEHPELIAERLVTYGRLVGRENIMAGTDCGLGTRVGHGAIALAKFQALAEGAKLASKRLWI